MFRKNLKIKEQKCSQKNQATKRIHFRLGLEVLSRNLSIDELKKTMSTVSKLNGIASVGDQKTKIAQYRDLLNEIFAAQQADDFNAFVDHMVSEDTPLVISRQILQNFAQILKDLPTELHKTVATYALAKLQPRVVAFEEQVSIIREHLASVYQDEEEWAEAAACLRAIPLDTGNRSPPDAASLPL